MREPAWLWCGSPPLANNVTSWPSATSSSASHDSTRSVTPYSFGGTLSARGAICATRILLLPRRWGTSPRVSREDNSTVDRWFMAGGARSTNQRELRASIDAGTRSDCCGHSALLEPLLQPRLQQGTRFIRRSAALTF